MFQKILVCLDGSKLAEQILPYAAEQASSFGSSLVLFQVVSLASLPTPTGIESVPVAVPNDQLAEAEAAAGDYLEALAVPLREKGLNVQCVAMLGQPAESIVSYAEENKFGLVALATHGRSGLKRLVFGSVADHVIRKSGLPILLIKPK
ncbi:MAG: universal stress protein [Dehalococcoidia bacterium]|nr:universal stress protein [Dehalococcoidia bacterium]